MKTVHITAIAVVITALLNLSAKANGISNGAAPSSKDSLVKIKNIVLVHGAFVDGSGWQPVYTILTRAGYHVSVVQQPLTSFANDLAAVKAVVDIQNGPCILVGHSYGGAIITEAGNDPQVAGLVYIAAHAPAGSGRNGGGQRKAVSFSL